MLAKISTKVLDFVKKPVIKLGVPFGAAAVSAFMFGIFHPVTLACAGAGVAVYFLVK